MNGYGPLCISNSHLFVIPKICETRELRPGRDEDEKQSSQDQRVCTVLQYVGSGRGQKSTASTNNNVTA